MEKKQKRFVIHYRDIDGNKHYTPIISHTKEGAIAWDDDQLKAFKENNKVQVSLITDEYLPIKDEHDNEIIDLIDESRLKRVGFINRN